MSFQLEIIPRRKYITRGPIGNINHYGHFILDLALPLFKHSKKIKTLYITKPLFNAMMGHFKKIYPNIKIIIGTSVSASKLKIQGYCWVNYHKSHLLEEKQLFSQHIVNLAKKTLIQKSWPKIILIQRSVSKNYKENNGAKRRALSNHNQLVNQLANRYKESFQNIILENMDFLTQVLYFHNAEIIIGQYGSGLINVFWCRPNKTCICLTKIKFDGDKTYQKCCQSSKLKYIPIYCNDDSRGAATGWNAPINKILYIIRGEMI